MNGVTVVLSAIAFMFASSAFAQPPGGGGQGGQKVGLATSLQRGYANIRSRVSAVEEHRAAVYRADAGRAGTRALGIQNSEFGIWNSRLDLRDLTL